jgi:hypothetical protein
MTKTMNEKLNEVNSTAEEIENITNEIVNAYCSRLDDCMKFIGDVIYDEKNPITDAELESLSLALPNLLYFVNSASESLGIKEDIAKAFKTNKYNSFFLEQDGKIADKTVKADLLIQDETLIHLCYQRAYKRVKNKVEAGFEMLNSVKKVLSKRMLDIRLTAENSGKVIDD